MRSPAFSEAHDRDSRGFLGPTGALYVVHSGCQALDSPGILECLASGIGANSEGLAASALVSPDTHAHPRTVIGPQSVFGRRVCHDELNGILTWARMPGFDNVTWMNGCLRGENSRLRVVNMQSCRKTRNLGG